MSNKTRKAQVVIAALDAQNQSFLFLLLQTNERRGQFWQNVTGKIEEGESIEEGALREAIEETQLPVDHIVDIIDLGIVHEFVDQRNRNVHEKSFLIIVDKSWKVAIDPKEHQASRWVALKDITKDSVKFTGNFEALQKSMDILRHWGM